MSYYEATCGGRAGGVGDFNAVPQGCYVRLSDSGAIEIVDQLRAGWNGQLEVGLFKNDFIPRWDMIMSNLTPCNFSGYGGLQVTTGWSAAVMAGKRVITLAGQLTWEHDGGANQNWVFGYYVKDHAGNLLWAERFCPKEKRMAGAGDSIKVKPHFTIRNEFKDS